MKKILAILLTLVMAFTFVTPAFAAEESANEVVESINTGTLFIQKVYETIHLLVHGFSRVFESNCPMCNVVDATPADFAEVLANAAKGEVVSLDAGDYGVLTLGTIDGIGLAAKEGANVDKIEITAETVLKDVTISGFDFIIEAKNDYAIKINESSTLENVVFEDIDFIGTTTEKNTYGIRGNTKTGTVEVINCSFSKVGYAIYSSGKGGFASFKAEGCTFTNIKSWVIHLQYGFDGNMAIVNCEFDNCIGGISKHKEIVNGSTFTFTGNTIADNCKDHKGNGSEWFEITTNNAIIEGNTLGGVEWIPGAAQGIKPLS